MGGSNLLETTRLGGLEVTRLAIGGNPFSGFSHQGEERDWEMVSYYTAERIKEALRLAEAAGINTLFARADRHIVRVLREYWDEGGTLRWIAQTATDTPDPLMNIPFARRWGASACYLHGGQTEHFLANGAGGKIVEAVALIHDLGMPAGVAGHRPEDHLWVRENVECEFQMCSYYNPGGRARRLAAGRKFQVMARGEPVIDPDTGDVIGTREPGVVGVVVVEKINERFSLARVLSGRGFKVGQVLRPLAGGD